MHGPVQTLLLHAIPIIKFSKTIRETVYRFPVKGQCQHGKGSNYRGQCSQTWHFYITYNVSIHNKNLNVGKEILVLENE